MEFLIDILPEAVALVIAVAVVLARTTDTKLDDKIAKLARDNRKEINNAVRDVIADEENKRSL